MHHLLTTVVLVTAAAVAQSPTFPHIVLTQLTGAPVAAQLVEVDPVLGTVQPLGGFPSNTLPPLALAVDPYDGALLVALDQGAGTSSIVRLQRVGSGLVELPVAQVNGRVTELSVFDQDLFAAVDDATGGLYRMPRRGGAATNVFPIVNLTAMHGYAPSANFVMLAWTGRPGTPSIDSGTALLDLATSTFVFGPDSFANPNGLEVTGVVDLPTAVPRQLLCFTDGSFALFAGLISPTPQPVPTTPPIPAGGAVAMHPAGPYSVSPIALGGSAFPFLYSVEAFSGTVTVLSAALPGAPVDFAYGLPTFAHSETFGDACGATALAQGWTGLPQLGTTLGLQVQGPPNSLVILVAGLDDFAFGVLPAPLPGSCLLETSPDFLQAHVSNVAGAAVQPLQIPASPSFVGTVVFTQWAAIDLFGFSVSSAVAHWVGS